MRVELIKLTQWYRFVGNRVRDIFLVRTKMFLPMLSTTNRCMNFAHMIYMQYLYNEYYSALRKIALIAIVQALRPSQQVFGHVGAGHPGFNRY